MSLLITYLISVVITFVVLVVFFSNGMKAQISGWDIGLSILLAPLSIIVLFCLVLYGVFFT